MFQTILTSIRTSIRAKVMLVVLASTFAALITTGTVLVIYDLRTHKAAFVDDMATQAEIVGRASASALTFGDTLSANQNLGLLSSRPQISAAAIYASDGRMFASYRREQAKDAVLPPTSLADGHHSDHGRLAIFESVRDSDERVGTVYLEAHYDLAGRLMTYLGIVALALIASLAVALLMTVWMQNSVTHPILAIAEVARQIKERRDYSLRVRKTTTDETGQLVSAFNDMLGEVGSRTADLEGSNRQLEHEMLVRHVAERALLAANQRKDEFLATLAHELRNPLGPIRNAVHYLKLSKAILPEAAPTVEIIDRQVKHLARLIDDLLDISRITRNALELKFKTFRLTELMRDVSDTCKYAVEEAGHQLVIRTPHEPVFLRADQARIAQAVTNILNNSVKYTPRGGNIELVAQCNGDDLVITITDTGIGIPEDRLTDIFQPFSQIDRSLERTRGGLGIGLALCQQLVGLHGGRVTAFSGGPGTGSTFRIVLPVLTTEIAPPSSPEAAVVTPVPSTRVLIADDNIDAAQTLASLLRQSGYDPVTAHDGEEALTIAAASRFDAAVLDIGMPRMNGYELARRLRHDPMGHSVFLIALTGWGKEDDKERARAAGFDVHLTKPAPPDQLLGILKQLRERTA